MYRLYIKSGNECFTLSDSAHFASVEMSSALHCCYVVLATFLPAKLAVCFSAKDKHNAMGCRFICYLDAIPLTYG